MNFILFFEKLFSSHINVLAPLIYYYYFNVFNLYSSEQTFVLSLLAFHYFSASNFSCSF